ncbi:MAG TPA: GNAT family N-acetyltransferase, partial [Gemmatimonadaceae bacterium]
RAAGYVTSWEEDGRRLIAYWLGREYWGRGLARSAVDEFLRIHERQRPIHAYVALSNARSIRVLEKCGFERAGEPTVGPDGVAEALFQFDGVA